MGIYIINNSWKMETISGSNQKTSILQECSNVTISGINHEILI